MKKIFTILSLLAVAGGAHAQLKFEFATAPKNHVGTDTVYGIVLTSLPATPDAQDHHWDCSSMILSGYKYYSVFAAEGGFTNATHSNLMYVDILPGIKYQAKYMFSVESTGIKTYGERLAQQTFSLTSQTGGPNDKIVVKAQDITYSAPQVQLPYPATIGTKWNSTSNSVTNLELTYSPLYNSTPSQRKTIITSTSEVVGYGNLRIKRTDGKASGSKPVLQVKTTLNFKDSFFVGGVALPDAALQQLGLTQGQNTTVYQKSYYREYEMLPLMNITYNDATYTTREDVNVHPQRLPHPDGINDVVAVVAEIYPNPSNGAFTVRVDDATGKWAYKLTDVTGKVVAAAGITFSNNEARIALNTIPGTYILTVEKDGNAVSGQQVIIR